MRRKTRRLEKKSTPTEVKWCDTVRSADLRSRGGFHLKRLGQPLRFGVGMGSGVLFALRFPKCRIAFRSKFYIIFCCRSGPFWGPILCLFGGTLVPEFRNKKSHVSEYAPGRPRPPPHGQNQWKRWEGCLKSRVHLLASGCLWE